MLVKELREKGRMVAVGIELNSKTELADFYNQIIQTFVQAGFSAGDGDAIQKAVTLLKKGKQLVAAHAGGSRAVHELVIVAVRTSEVALPEKNRAGDVAGIIQKGHFLQAVYFHGRSFLII
jgi:hypothetical protein